MDGIRLAHKITRETIESRTRTITFDAAPLRLDDSDRLTPILNGWLGVVQSRCELEVALDALQRSRTDPVFDVPFDEPANDAMLYVPLDEPANDYEWRCIWMRRVVRTTERAIALPLPKDPETLPLDGSLQQTMLNARTRDSAKWVYESCIRNAEALSDQRFLGRGRGLMAINGAVSHYTTERFRRGNVYSLASEAFCEFTTDFYGGPRMRKAFIERCQRRIRAVLPFVLPDVNIVIGGKVVTTGPTTLNDAT